MRKFLSRLLLFLMLCVSVLGANVTVFAEDTRGLDLSKFKEKSIKEYGGIYEDRLFFESGCSYFFLYFDDTDFYCWATNKNDESEFIKLTADKANELISDSKNYTLCDSDNEYSYVTNTYEVDAQEVHNFYIFVYDNEENTFNTLGTFNSAASIADVSVLDLSQKAPEADVKVVTDDKGTKIKVSYSEKAGVGSVVCYNNEKGCDIGVVNDTQLEGEGTKTCYFDILENGNYTIEVYGSSYMSKDFEHTEYKLSIDSIESETFETVSPEHLDKTKPKITFGKLPSSGIEGDYLTFMMYSDEPVILNFNGTASEDYVTEMEVTVAYNGNYHYSAVDKGGNVVDDYYTVDFFNGVDNIEKLDFDFDKREALWSKTSESKLPQTGGINLLPVLLMGIVLVIGGTALIVRVKAKSSDK